MWVMIVPLSTSAGGNLFFKKCEKPLIYKEKKRDD